MNDIDRQERIRIRAYEIWERQGRLQGEQDRHWDQAERELEAEEASAGSTGSTGGWETSEERLVDTGYLQEEPAEGGRGKAERAPKRQQPVGKPRKGR